MARLAVAIMTAAPALAAALGLTAYARCVLFAMPRTAPHRRRYARPQRIRERLSVRHGVPGRRRRGVHTGGHAACGPRERPLFASALHRALTRALRASAAQS